jgi:DNA repair protein RadC
MQTYSIPDTFLVLDSGLYEYPMLLRDRPDEQKPREKLMSRGPESLTIQELLALILVTGTTREDVAVMAERLIRGYGEKSILSERDPKRLSQDRDIPLVKACQIVAVGELGRRAYERQEHGFSVVRNAKDVYELLSDMRNLPKECLRGLFLNNHNRVIRNELISIGTASWNVIHPREVFRPGLESNAVAVILAHNHPSGTVTPSAEDVTITEQLIQAGKILGIRVLDHVIITKDAFASVKAEY